MKKRFELIIDDATMVMIDEQARKLKLSRNSLIKMQLEKYVDELNQQRAVEQLNIPLQSIAVSLDLFTKALNENTHFVTNDLKKVIQALDKETEILMEMKNGDNHELF